MKKIKDPPQQSNLFEQYEQSTIHGLHRLKDGEPERGANREIRKTETENVSREPNSDGLNVRNGQGEISENIGLDRGAEQSDSSGDRLRQHEVPVNRGGDAPGRGAGDSVGSAVKPVGPFIDFRREPIFAIKPALINKGALEANLQSLRSINGIVNYEFRGVFLVSRGG